MHFNMMVQTRCGFGNIGGHDQLWMNICRKVAHASLPYVVSGECEAVSRLYPTRFLSMGETSRPYHYIGASGEIGR